MPANIGPLAPDVLTHIINVHWGGGATFVIGDDSGQIWRCVLKDINSAPNLDKIKEQFGEPFPDNTASGEVDCGSFANVTIAGVTTPVFVLGGFDWQFEGSILYPAGMIKTSPDGISWKTISYDEGNDGIWRLPRRMIWDEANQKFYADVEWRSAQSFGVDPTFARETWASSDGVNWEVVAHQEGQGGPNSSFDAHCKYKRQDEEGFESGRFGVDPAKQGSTAHFNFGHVIDDGLLITIEDLPGQISLVFAGGLWGSEGKTDGSAFEVSGDDANTWKRMGNVIPAIDELGTIRVICAADLTPHAGL
jgi:hypothetical protein